MKVKEFNALKKKVKEGNVEGLNHEVIKSLTLNQAQVIEDLMLDLELTDEMNKILDEVVNYIDSLVDAEKHTTKKVANTKAPKVEAKTEPEPEKVKPAKPEPKKVKAKKLFDKVKVNDIVRFQVEGEQVKHDIRIIYKGKANIIAVMVDDEQEVFNIRKTDFNKQVFEWTDRHGETYNIIVTI